MKNERLDPEIELLLRLIDEAYEKKAWHGTNLRGALRGVSAEDALWRPAPARHNVWELAVHAAYWKYAVRRRLTGEKRGSFSLKGSNWFKSPKNADDEAWHEIVALLDREHRALRKIIARLPAKALRVNVRASKYINRTLIYGVAAHDVYHTGQIQLIKRLKTK
jgi:uncharacterized damage-inducible protein DinB